MSIIYKVEMQYPNEGKVIVTYHSIHNAQYAVHCCRAAGGKATYYPIKED